MKIAAFWENPEKIRSKFSNNSAIILANFATFLYKKISKSSAIFNKKIDIKERCKGVHCVDLGESFPTSIFLQKSASIQPRTSLSKFGGKFNSSFIRFLNAQPFTQLERWWIGNYDSGGAQQWEDISQYKRVLGESTRRLSF